MRQNDKECSNGLLKVQSGKTPWLRHPLDNSPHTRICVFVCVLCVCVCVRACVVWVSYKTFQHFLGVRNLKLKDPSSENCGSDDIIVHLHSHP